MSEADGNKRKRLTQACELCRRKKIKCDGSKPTCGNCTRLNMDCTYTSSNKKRGPRQGYIELLEQRLAKMEKVLLTPELNRNNNEEEDDDQYQQPTSPTSFSSISSNVTSPPPPRPSQPQQQQEQHQQRVLPAPIDTTRCNSNNNNSNSGFQELVLHALGLYFTNLFPCLPLFDHVTIRRDIEEGRCSEFLKLSLLAACARFSDRPELKQNPAWRSGEKFAQQARAMLMKAVDEPSLSNVQALTLLTLHEYGCGRGPRSWMYGGMTIRMAMELGLHEESDDAANENNAERLIQKEVRRRVFWTVFSIDQFSSAASGRPSSLHSISCTSFLPGATERRSDDQYYTETLDGKNYILLNVGGLKDSQLLGINYTNQPVSTVKLGRKPHLNCFSYLVRATDILAKVTTFVNLKRGMIDSDLPPFHPDSEFSKLDKMVEDWYEQLPLHLQNTHANFELSKSSEGKHNRQFILLHALHNTLRVLLHRPSLVLAEQLSNASIVQPELKDFISQSVDKCMAAVDNVTILLKEIGTSLDLMPPFLTYLTYTVATVVVSTSFSQREEEATKAKNSLGVYFQVLLAARNYWAMADKLYFMIRDLYAIHSNVLRKQREQDSKALNRPQQQQQQQPVQTVAPQQQYQQQQQQPQPQQPQQFTQLQQSTLFGGSDRIMMADWNMNNSYYDENTPPGLFPTNTADYTFLQNNPYQMPVGYDQPFAFQGLLSQPNEQNSSSASSSGNDPMFPSQQGSFNFFNPDSSR